MRKIICIAVVAVLISACQTRSHPPTQFSAPKQVSDVAPQMRASAELIGTGDFVLDGDLNDFIRLEYFKSDSAGFVIVSGDGLYAEALYCADAATSCEIDQSVFDAISSCENRTNQACFIYMQGQKVVWNGRNHIRTSQRTVVRPDELNDTQLCHYAVNHAEADAKWTTDRVGKYYATEARKREIPLSKCKALVVETADAPRKYKVLTDGEICNLAVTGVAGVEAWSPIRKNLSYVNEGIARGFTPITCMDAVFGKSS